MTETASARPALDESTTHILHFSPYCGATPLDRFRGNGLWVLMTAGDYARGYKYNERGDWIIDSPKSTAREVLAAWVAVLAGYPVKLTRADDLIDPDWPGSMAYRVTRRRDG